MAPTFHILCSIFLSSLSGRRSLIDTLIACDTCSPLKHWLFLGESVNTLLFGGNIVAKHFLESCSLLKHHNYVKLSYSFTSSHAYYTQYGFGDTVASETTQSIKVPVMISFVGILISQKLSITF